MPNLIGSSFGHEHSTPPIGFAVDPVSTTKTHKYTIRIKVTRTHTHKWNRVILVVDSPKTKTHKYNITTRVSTTKTHRFNSGGKIKPPRKRTHLWNIIAKITRTHTHKFTVTIKVQSNTKTHKYNVIQKIVRTHTHKWSEAGRLYDDVVKTHKYNIIARVTRTHTQRWNILTPKILETEIQYYKSSNTANSLGGAIDLNSPIVHNTKHNLFDVVTATESSTGESEYRCLYVRNISNRSLLGSAKVWIETNTPSQYSAVTIGLGTSAIGGTEQTIANEETAPTDVTFGTANGISNAVAIGNLTAGQHKAVWLKRVINSGSQAYNDDSFTIGFAGDTYASE